MSRRDGLGRSLLVVYSLHVHDQNRDTFLPMFYFPLFPGHFESLSGQVEDHFAPMDKIRSRAQHFNGGRIYCSPAEPSTSMRQTYAQILFCADFAYMEDCSQNKIGGDGTHIVSTTSALIFPDAIYFPS